MKSKKVRCAGRGGWSRAERVLLWPRLCHSFEVHLSLFHVVSLLHSEFGGDFNGEGTVSDKSLREISCLCTGCADFSMENNRSND